MPAGRAPRQFDTSQMSRQCLLYAVNQLHQQHRTAPHRPLLLSGRFPITEDQVLHFGTRWTGGDVIYLATSTVNLPKACFLFVQMCLLTFAVLKMLSVLTFGCLVSRQHLSTVRCS